MPIGDELAQLDPQTTDGPTEGWLIFKAMATHFAADILSLTWSHQLKCILIGGDCKAQLRALQAYADAHDAPEDHSLIAAVKIVEAHPQINRGTPFLMITFYDPAAFLQEATASSDSSNAALESAGGRPQRRTLH